MAKAGGPRPVQCYHCGHRFEVAARAQSVPCPRCHKALLVGDEVIKSGLRGPLRELRTCGKVVVGKKARLIAELIEAHAGIENEGIIDAKKIITGGTLVLSAKSTFKGTVHAAAVHMELGAIVQPSRFEVPSDPKGLLERREES